MSFDDNVEPSTTTTTTDIPQFFNTVQDQSSPITSEDDEEDDQNNKPEPTRLTLKDYTTPRFAKIVKKNEEEKIPVEEIERRRLIGKMVFPTESDDEETLLLEKAEEPSETLDDTNAEGNDTKEPEKDHTKTEEPHKEDIVDECIEKVVVKDEQSIPDFPEDDGVGEEEERESENNKTDKTKLFLRDR